MIPEYIKNRTFDCTDALAVAKRLVASSSPKIKVTILKLGEINELEKLIEIRGFKFGFANLSKDTPIEVGIMLALFRLCANKLISLRGDDELLVIEKPSVWIDCSFAN